MTKNYKTVRILNLLQILQQVVSKVGVLLIIITYS